MKPNRIFSLLFLVSTSVLLLLWVTACKTDPVATPKSSAKTISSFTFGSLNPAVAATVSGNSVMATVPFGTNVTALAPTIVLSDKATVSPASGVAQNFASSVNYTVTAEDGSTQVYTVAVGVGAAPKSPAKDITAFTFNGLTPAVNCTIDAITKVISGTLPAGTDATKLVPALTLSPKATVTPATGIMQDFSKTVTYTVTAEDGTTQAYSATMTVTQPTTSATLNEVIYFGSSDKNIYALNAKTNAVIWKYLTNGDASKSTPLLANGILYAISADQKLYALNAADGAKKWEYSTLEGTKLPTLSNGLIYLCQGYKTFALDAATGTKKWEFEQASAGTVFDQLTVVGGVVYMGGSSCCNYIPNSYFYALDATTGAKKWEISVANGSYGRTPAVGNGLVYVSSFTSSGTATKLLALDLATGAKKWELSLGSGSSTDAVATPILDNGLLYAATDDGRLIAADAKTGTQKWAYSTVYPASTTPISFGGRLPVIQNGILYVSDRYYTYAFDAATGIKKWQFEEKFNKPSSSPTTANGRIYVGYNDYGVGLFTLDATTGAKLNTFPIAGGGQVSQPCVVDKNGVVYRGGLPTGQ